MCALRGPKKPVGGPYCYYEGPKRPLGGPKRPLGGPLRPLGLRRKKCNRVAIMRGTGDP